LQAAASSSRAQLCLYWVSCDLLRLIRTELFSSSLWSSAAAAASRALFFFLSFFPQLWYVLMGDLSCVVY
jgi:hypothetical protein